MGSLFGTSPAGTTTTTTNRTPWKAQQPYLQNVFRQAANLYQNSPGPQFYPGTQVAPFRTPTNQYIAGAQNYGRNTQLDNAASYSAQNMLNPNFLNSTPGQNTYQAVANGAGINPATGLAGALAYNTPGSNTLQNLQNQGQSPIQSYLQNYANGGMFNNPNLQNTLNQTNANLLNQYQTRTAPGIDSQMEMAGRYGSGASAAAQGAGQRALLSQTATADANLLNQNYFQSMQNQLNAANMIQQGTTAQQQVQANAANAQAQNANQAAALFGNVGNQNVQSILAGAQGLGTDYNNAAVNQARSQANAQAINTMPLRNLQALQRAGSTTDAFNQATLNGLINQYTYNQTLPYNNLSAFEQFINGNFGGTSTRTSPYFSSAGTQLAGAAISALPGLIAASDCDLKENIETIGDHHGIPLVTFNYKSDPSRRYAGVIAQDVEKVCPEAVSKRDGIRYVDYAKLGLRMIKVN